LKFRVGAAGVLLLSSFLLSGCARPPSLPKKAPVLPKGQLPTITVIPGGSESYWNEARRGAEAAGKKLNAKIVWKAPSGKDKDALLKSQQKLIEDAIETSQGIAAAPVDSTQMMRFFREVALAGLPVVAFDRDVYTIQNKLTFVHNDDYEAGVLVAREAKKVAMNPTNVVLLAASERPEIEERISGFRSEFKNQAPKAEITQAGDITFSTNTEVGISIDEELSPEIISNPALKTKVILFRSEGLDNSKIAAVIQPDYYQMGYQSVKAIMDYRAVKDVPHEIKIAPRLVTKNSADTLSQTKPKPN
jgi:ABC-type sugar transport system substrate-binding protein